MKQFLLLVICLTCAQALLLLPDQHKTLQEICGDIIHSPLLDSVDADVKAKLHPHLLTVCQLYDEEHAFLSTFNKPNSPPIFPQVEVRSLLDGLSGLLGDNSQLSTLLKAASALGKAKDVFDELKNLAPSVHDSLSGGIQDVHDSLNDIIDNIAKSFGGLSPTTASPIKARGLLDGLGGLLGDNSQLSTLLKAASALGKAKDVFDELKQLAPTVHNSLSGGIQDVHDGLNDIIDSIAKTFGGLNPSTTTVQP